MHGAVVRLALLVLAAAVGVGAWALWFRADEAPVEEEPVRSRLYAVEQDAIVSVRVATPDGEAAFVRGAGGWTFAGDPLTPVNLDRWGGVVLLLSGPHADRELPPGPDPAEYGLDAPSTVTVGLADGGAVTVRLGDATPDGEHRYVSVEGRAGVALVNAPWGDVLARLVSEPPHPYWRYDVDPALVRVFEAETERGVVTFLLGIEVVDGEPSSRVVVGDGARDLSDAERAALRGVVGGPSALRTLPLPEGASPASLGFEPPHAVVRLGYELPPNASEGLLYSGVYSIGGLTPDGAARYVRVDDPAPLLAFDAGWVAEVAALVERYIVR